jgi:cytochrome bd-type quinol oxidase subunit 2
MNTRKNYSTRGGAMFRKLLLGLFAVILSVSTFSAVAMAEERPAEELQVVIGDGEIPLSNVLGEYSWAVANLFIMLIIVAFAVFMMVRFFRKKRSGEQNAKRVTRGFAGCIVIVAIAVVAAALFFITEDFTLKMVVSDNITLLMLLMLGWQAVIAVLLATNKTFEPHCTVLRIDE